MKIPISTASAFERFELCGTEAGLRRHQDQPRNSRGEELPPTAATRRQHPQDITRLEALCESSRMAEASRSRFSVGRPAPCI